MRTLKLKKFIIFWAVLILLLPCLVHASDGNKTDQASYQAIVLDDADLLTQDQENDLLEYVKPILSSGNVIISSVKLKKSVDYEKNCQDVYYEHFGNQPGVNMQIDMGNRKITLSCSTDMETILGSERDSIVSNIYQYATDKDYYSCYHECFREIQVILNDGTIAHNMKYIDNAILAIFAGLLINAVFVFLFGRRKKKKAKLLGNIALVGAITDTSIHAGKISKIYDPVSSSSDSSGGSSGGGDSGGFSGGSSSHGF